MSECEHKWVERKDGYKEQCGPAICILCGKYGCYCDAGYISKPPEQRASFIANGILGNNHEIEKQQSKCETCGGTGFDRPFDSASQPVLDPCPDCTPAIADKDVAEFVKRWQKRYDEYATKSKYPSSDLLEAVWSEFVPKALDIIEQFQKPVIADKDVAEFIKKAERLAGTNSNYSDSRGLLAGHLIEAIDIIKQLQAALEFIVETSRDCEWRGERECFDTATQALKGGGK